MKIIVLKCPQCGANIDIENGVDSFFCKYCGCNIIVEGQTDTCINAKVRMRELENEKHVHDRKLDQEDVKIKIEHEKQKEKAFLEKSKIYFAMGAIIVGVLVICGSLFSKWVSHGLQVKKLESIVADVQKDIEDGNYDAALIKVEKLNYDAGWSVETEYDWDRTRWTLEGMIKEKKEQAYRENPNNIFPPMSAESIRGDNYIQVVEMLKSAGFTNIEAIGIDESSGLFQKKEDVSEISISGNTDFSEADLFSKDARILIYYYTR